jgi:hypothetical protein
MASIIKLKRGTSTPTTSNIVSGEVAVDTSARKIYINDSGVIKEIGGAASSSSDSLINGSFTVQLDSNGVLNLPQTAFIYDDSVTFTTTDANQTLDTFSPTVYRSAKYVIQATSGTDIHATELLIMHNDSSVLTSQTNTIYSNASLITLGASIVDGNVVVTVTPANADTVVDFVRTSLLSREIQFVLEGDLQSLTGSVDLLSGTGTVDLSEGEVFTLGGDYQILTGTIDLMTATGTEDLSEGEVFTLGGDYQTLTGTIDLLTATGTEDLSL